MSSCRLEKLSRDESAVSFEQTADLVLPLPLCFFLPSLSLFLCFIDLKDSVLTKLEWEKILPLRLGSKQESFQSVLVVLTSGSRPMSSRLRSWMLLFRITLQVSQDRDGKVIERVDGMFSIQVANVETLTVIVSCSFSSDSSQQL